jgi:hypothetical protein
VLKDDDWHGAMAFARAIESAVLASQQPATQQQQAALSDERIKAITTGAVRAGKLSWIGYEKDEDGKHTTPSLSPFHYQFARTILAASHQPAQAAMSDEQIQAVDQAALSEALDHVALLVAKNGTTEQGRAALKLLEDFCASQQPAAAQREINAALDRADAEDAARYPAAPVQAAVVPDGEWQRAQAICDMPAVDEAIRGFTEDSTGDNATMIVREVMRALAAPSPAQVQPADAAPAKAVDERAARNVVAAWSACKGFPVATSEISAIDKAVRELESSLAAPSEQKGTV